jgi:hypothetical protein
MNNNTYYFGVYNTLNTLNTLNIENPENYIDNYAFLLKVNKTHNNVFNIVDVLYTNYIFDITNSDMFMTSFNKYSFTKNMILYLDTNNNIININYLNKNAYNFKLYYSNIDIKCIFLDTLDKIKENIIKNNKILSE